MPVGKALHLRLFLEGIEVPVVSAQVSINVGAPATASIQIVPLDSAMDFLPRTMVHLFFLDTKVDTSEGPRKPNDPRLSGTYRLLFSGEVVGFAWSQTPASRGLVLQCLDFSNYWDSAHVHAISYGPGGNAFDNHGTGVGAATGLFTDIPGDSAAEHLVRWINEKPSTPGLTGISGLAGGIIHVMEVMGGVLPRFKGVNDFFTVAELRCRLLNQITAEENDSTASRVLSIGVFHEWLKNGIQQAGGNITFRDVMKLLFQYIYYEFVPNPAPKFDASFSSKTGKKVQGELANSSVVKKAVADLTKVIEILAEGNYLGLGGLDTASNLLKVTARVHIKTINDTITHLKALGGATSKSTSNLTKASAGLKAYSDRPAAQPADSKTIPGVISLLNAAIDDLSTGTVTNTVGSVSSSAQRLRAQIIRPDCWFAAPPACNVIFPESYAQISYDRNYLQEVTRTYTRKFESLIGRDQLISGPIVMAPQAGLDATKLAKFKGSQSFRTLMDHEIHVGIISKMEWVPNTANSGGGGLNAQEEKKVKNGRLNWMLRVSLFNFFKYRFAARQVSVAGRFNPFVVCGFPGAVITRPYIIPGGVDTLRELKGTSGGQKVTDGEVNDLIDSFATELNAPSHFVGMIGAVQHSIDQSGGTTNVVMHHARKHRGIDDEFVGVLLSTNEKTTKRIVRVVLDLSKAKGPGKQDSLRLLAGVTPQSILEKSTTSSETTLLFTQKTVVGASSKSNVPGAVAKTSITTTTVSESAAPSTSSQSPSPDGTEWGHVPGNDNQVWVPSGSTQIKVNDSKGRYGGKIVGIQVLDAHIQKVDFSDSTKTVEEFQQFSSSATATQSTEVPVLASLSKKVVTKGRKSVKVFTKVAVYEEVKVPVSGTLPVEELLRPSWFSTSYSNDYIGKKIYQPFFGCDSVVDGLSAPGTAPVGTDSSADETTVDSTTISGGDLVKRLSAEESAKRSNSVEKALNILGFIYGQVKTQGSDVDAFVRDYNDRPIATFQDIFGEPDLEFSFTAGAVGANAKVKKKTKDGVSRTPAVGFHTAATHPTLVDKGNLVGLTTDLEQGFSRAGGIGKSEPLVTRYDVRKAKMDRVKIYLTDLEKGPGLKG